jgi:hypothetical protein
MRGGYEWLRVTSLLLDLHYKDDSATYNMQALLSRFITYSFCRTAMIETGQGSIVVANVFSRHMSEDNVQFSIC